MRWKKKVKKIIKDGTIIKFEKFLLIPKCIGGEWLWFEKVLVEKKYVDRRRDFNELNPKHAIRDGFWSYSYRV